MGQRLPRITAAQMIKVLERRGFRQVRQSGSHKVYRNTQGIRTTVPFHSKVILKPKTLKSILKDTDMTAGELQAEL